MAALAMIPTLTPFFHTSRPPSPSPVERSKSKSSQIAIRTRIHDGGLIMSKRWHTTTTGPVDLMGSWLSWGTAESRVDRGSRGSVGASAARIRGRRKKVPWVGKPKGRWGVVMYESVQRLSIMPFKVAKK